MKTVDKGRIDRRSLLRGGAAVALGWLLARSVVKPVAAQQAVPRIVAVRVPQAPVDPAASEWASAQPVDVSMNPQNITTPRIQEAGVKSLRVRGLYDGDRLAVLAEWSDPNRETGLGTVASFRDAVAMQFPSHPDQATPYFGMGGPGTPVTIYQWKSDWQYAPKQDVDEAYPNMAVDVYPFSGVEAGRIPEATDYKEKGDLAYISAWKAGNALADLALQSTTSVEKLTAEGFGTAKTASKQDGQGNGVWERGAWKIVISAPRVQESFSMAEGQVLPLAFAAWDGSRKERNGRKAFSTWNEISFGAVGGLQPAVMGGIAVVAVAAMAGVAAALWIRLRGGARTRAS